MIKSYQLGLLLCDVPQGKDSLDVNIQGQGSSSSGESRQYLHDWLKTGRVASITQNFERDNSSVNISVSNRSDKQIVDGLLKT